MSLLIILNEKDMPFRSILSLLGICLFAFLGIATSQDEPPLVVLDVDFSLTADSTAVIIKNNDDFDYEEATVGLISNGNIAYDIDGYSLASLTTDTLAINQFINADGFSFPEDDFPKSFFIHNFSEEGYGEFAFQFE